jgi:hypothetical protein
MGRTGRNRGRVSASLDTDESIFRACLCAIAIILACNLTACRKPVPSTPAITMEHEIAPSPPRVGPARITLNMVDAQAQAVTGARIRIEGNMSHAGMGPVFSDAKELLPGRYESDLEFSMAGDWVILVHSTLSNGQKFERQFEVKGVRPD